MWWKYAKILGIILSLTEQNDMKHAKMWPWLTFCEWNTTPKGLCFTSFGTWRLFCFALLCFLFHVSLKTRNTHNSLRSCVCFSQKGVPWSLFGCFTVISLRKSRNYSRENSRFHTILRISAAPFLGTPHALCEVWLGMFRKMCYKSKNGL